MKRRAEAICITMLSFLMLFPGTAQALLPAPTGVVVTASVLNEAVSWNGVTGALAYGIYRSTLQRDGIFSGEQLVGENISNPPTPPVAAFLDISSSLKRTNTYRYSVTACTSIPCTSLTESPHSDTTTATVASAIPPFAAASPYNLVSFSSTTLPGSELGTNFVILSGPSQPPNCGIPVFQAESGDGSVSVSNITSDGDRSYWPQGDFKLIDLTVPVPPGSYIEKCGTTDGGDDSHIAVIDSTRTKSYEFWNVRRTNPGSCSSQGVCSGCQLSTCGWNNTQPPGTPSIIMGDPNGCTNCDLHGTIAQIDLTGPGFSTCPTYNNTQYPQPTRTCPSAQSDKPENSARGSGTPLVDTVLRPEETYYGIRHALGITVPSSIHCGFLSPPAAHEDSTCTLIGGLVYGHRVVLSPTFNTTGMSIGAKNIVKALQSYGAFVIDQGNGQNCGIDLSSYDPGGFYSLAGVTPSMFNHSDGSGGLQCSDFLLSTGAH